MKVEEANLAVQFMRRVDLKGTEVEAWTQVMSALNHDIQVGQAMATAAVVSNGDDDDD